MFCVGGVPIRPGTLLVPRVRCKIKKLRTLQKAISVVMAGAEGIEPSALGFGDRCSTS